jgi:hypothetical protein
MNALTIANALATRYLPANITPPAKLSPLTGSYGNIRHSTAAIPNTIPTSPWVLVMLPQGEVVLGAQETNHTMQFHVMFHFAKITGDLRRDMTAMLAWLGVLLGATYADMDLGVTGIRKAYPTTYELAVFTYGGDEYYGWDITVVVDYREAQVMAA